MTYINDAMWSIMDIFDEIYLVLKAMRQQLSEDDCNPNRYLSVHEGLSVRGKTVVILSNRLGNFLVGLDLIYFTSM